MKGVLMSLSVCLGLLWSVAAAESPLWNLPTELNDSNTSITFEVDSTWHMIHGTTKEISGRAWLAKPNDPLSIQATIDIPVALFDTDSRRRDSRLREVMSAENYPKVNFSIASIDNLCNPVTIGADGCRATINGTVSIRGVSKQLSLPVTITREQEHYLVQGRASLQWATFGVEDPSILIAKLKPTVNVSVKVRL